MKGMDAVHVEVDVALERSPAPFRKVAAPNLEMDPDAEALHDRIDAARLVIRWLKNAVCRIELETQNVPIVLRCFTDLPDPEDR